MAGNIDHLLGQIRQCRLCQNDLPLGANPVVQAATGARLLIIGQAPGTRVHASGIPWDDPSGDRLREWLNLDKDTFYDPGSVAIVPMGFCYPGKGNSGDLPPRKECAPAWHNALLALLPGVQLTLLIGDYAQRYYLNSTPDKTRQTKAGREQAGKPRTLTQTVKQGEQWAPGYFPLPHPSPRNNLWLKKNPWFEQQTLPRLRQNIDQLFNR